MGLAASGIPMDYISAFLDPSQHAAGIPLDYVSFHFYASPADRMDPQGYEVFFE